MQQHQMQIVEFKRLSKHYFERFMFCPWTETVTKRVPLRSKHNVEKPKIGLLYVLNWAITTLLTIFLYNDPTNTKKQ